MNKRNYQKELESIIKNKEEEKTVPSLLLHSCCAPCSSYVLEYLSDHFNITVFYYNPNIYPAEEYGIDPRQAKVEDAQAELAEAGYPNGEGFPEVEITYANTEKNKRLCEAIQQMLETNLNIKVKLRAEESSVFSSTKSKGDYQMAPGGWTNNPYDASGLIKLFYSQNGNNTCQWRWREYKGAPNDTTLNPGNKAFDEAFDKAMASLGEERDAAWEEANKALMDDMPITALYYPSFVALVNEDQVENVELTLGNSFMFSHAEIVE